MVDYSYKKWYLAECKEKGWEPHSYFAKGALKKAKEEAERMVANRKSAEEYYSIHLTESDEPAVYTMSPERYEEITGIAKGTEEYVEKVLEAIEECDREEKKANEKRIKYMIEAIEDTELYNTDPSWKAKADFLEREIMNIRLANRK